MIMSPFCKNKCVVPKCIFLTFLCILPSTSAIVDEEYDFVIVGGGTAGCAVANRLSENGKHSVLLLEAGGEPHPDLDIPALSTNYLDDSFGFTRTYQSLNQLNAGLANNGTVGLMVGRVLGGSSSVNGMYWNRGSPFDFDNWARITNDSSWRYSNLLQFFKKSENYMGRFPSDQHAHGGPITISRPNYAPLLQEWLDAGRHLGYPNGDPNGPQRVSYTSLEFSKRLGRRVSSYSGYLKPVMGRRNLRVVTGAEATQIIIDGKRARGVRFHVSRQASRQVFARKEVIISAGTVESPALLMRSGIGPKRVLRDAKIPQIAELPVGRNFQDHVELIVQFIINNASGVYDPERDLNPETLATFNKFADGPYTSYVGSSAQFLLKSSVRNGDKRWADVIGYFMASVNSWGLLSGASNFALADWEVPVGVLVNVGRPRSRGSVTLNPRNPNGLPIVDLRYFDDSQDLQIMVDGIKAALATFERTPSFRKLGARFPPEPISACKNLQFRSDAYWRCYARQLSGSGVHPCGTNRMGRGANDPDAVVDSKLRVIGVSNLRVVDASIMPVITTTNLQAPVYAIAEKGAHMILHNWKGK